MAASTSRTGSRLARLRRLGARELALALALSVWALESCDLAPRDPEDPVPEQGPLVALTDPDSVLEQIRLGFESGIITSYMNAFSDSFRFEPDEVDAATFQDPTTFDNWDKNVERDVAQFIFLRFSSRLVSFTDVDSFPGEVVQLNEDYSLQLDTSAYRGQAELHLRRDAGGDWRIVLWRDRRQGDDPPSWTVLRGENR